MFYNKTDALEDSIQAAVDDGELTYTLKIKRRVIEDRYKDVIARLYADVEEPRPQHLA